MPASRHIGDHDDHFPKGQKEFHELGIFARAQAFEQKKLQKTKSKESLGSAATGITLIGMRLLDRIEAALTTAVSEISAHVTVGKVHFFFLHAEARR
eukprot:CAMPEP_0119349152 /NCGR_PEP_ID=MMETSP1333-20130426/109407_1 /TAXON_ID=418940 /ORGANISM="Scyphosphaera apsteinii, Strain RCC1455" /LENGTH=96 /DNA_ID=CAMNT_0007361747 /DNA_START=235 /DNA_END=529 /DNA_ORIENTATION=-